MPTYTYRCSDCEQQLEVVQSMSDDPFTECAACGGTLHKVLHPVGIVLKGSGFYRTDNRSSSGSSRPTGSGSTPDSGASSKTDKASKTDGASKTDKTSKTDSKGTSSSATSGSGSARAKSA